MTNFEKWKDEILEIVKHHDNISVVNGEPKPCDEGWCWDCKFNDSPYSCRSLTVEWLYEEYKEPSPKLTKREWYFLTLVGTGYIARDSNEDLMWYEKKPYRGYSHDTQFWDTDDEYNEFYGLNLSQMFSFVTWESEPWKVEDLLKLEVEE